MKSTSFIFKFVFLVLVLGFCNLLDCLGMPYLWFRLDPSFSSSSSYEPIHLIEGNAVSGFKNRQNGTSILDFSARPMVGFCRYGRLDPFRPIESYTEDDLRWLRSDELEYLSLIHEQKIKETQKAHENQRQQVIERQRRQQEQEQGRQAEERRLRQEQVQREHKQKTSTFFADETSRKEIMMWTEEAYSNLIRPITKRSNAKYRLIGRAKNGLTIIMDVTKTGDMDSVFLDIF